MALTTTEKAYEVISRKYMETMEELMGHIVSILSEKYGFDPAEAEAYIAVKSE